MITSRKRSCAPGSTFNNQRVPLVNPQRGIFKPRSMRYLLSIRTVFPRPCGRVWYDDQREVHRQIFEGDDAIDYAFMGNDPNAADNQWLRAAYENRIPVIWFVGIAPGRYQAIVPVYVAGWDAKALKARIVFDAQDQQELVAPQDVQERRYALRTVKQRLHQASFREAVISAYRGRQTSAVYVLYSCNYWAEPIHLSSPPLGTCSDGYGIELRVLILGCLSFFDYA